MFFISGKALTLFRWRIRATHVDFEVFFLKLAQFFLLLYLLFFVSKIFFKFRFVKTLSGRSVGRVPFVFWIWALNTTFTSRIRNRRLSAPNPLCIVEDWLWKRWSYTAFSVSWLPWLVVTIIHIVFFFISNNLDWLLPFLAFLTTCFIIPFKIFRLIF